MQKNCFTVIDNKTGKEVDIDKIKEEPWAEGLHKASYTPFCINENGELFLYEGGYGDCVCTCPPDRFRIEFWSQEELEESAKKIKDDDYYL